MADDEQLARDELCFLLQPALNGVEVVARAANGMEALDEIARHAPDVAFLDVQMPGLTGFEVARRLLEQGTGPGCDLRHSLSTSGRSRPSRSTPSTTC